MTLCWCGANFGGPTITQAPVTAGVEPLLRSLIVAVNGPSETSSYQSLLPQKLLIPEPSGEADLPNPPSTTRRLFVSLRISPSGTLVTGALVNLISPLSNT